MPRATAGKQKGKGKASESKQAVASAPASVFVWAQCDNAGCQKWRKLPPNTVVEEDVPWCALCCGRPGTKVQGVRSSSVSRPRLSSAPRHWQNFQQNLPALLHQRKPVRHRACLPPLQSNTTNALLVSMHRFCYMNPDPEKDTCSAPEEVRAHTLHTPTSCYCL